MVIIRGGLENFFGSVNKNQTGPFIGNLTPIPPIFPLTKKCIVLLKFQNEFSFTLKLVKYIIGTYVLATYVLYQLWVSQIRTCSNLILKFDLTTLLNIQYS